MEELKKLKERLSGERPEPWEALPDIALYMDQIISYMPRQMIRFDGSEALTPAMVNNYIKDGLLPRAEGKRYQRTHLAYLTAICALKQVLSVKEIKALFCSGAQERSPERLYDHYRGELDRALSGVAGELDDTLEEGDLSRLALDLALRSYANKLACQQVLSLLQPEEEETPDPKKSKNKPQ